LIAGWIAETPLLGHPFDRRQPQAGKIGRKGGRRPSHVTRSALVGDLAQLHTEVRGGWPPLQLARLALIVTALGRYCGRGEDSRADAAVARRA
jgi:hypothetical protein